MSFTLGSVPSEMLIRLSSDADFSTIIVNSQGVWEPDVVIKLVFGDGTIWPATIVGAEARWKVDKIDVNTLINTAHARNGVARLLYMKGADDVLWATGRVRVSG